MNKYFIPSILFSMISIACASEPFGRSDTEAGSAGESVVEDTGGSAGSTISSSGSENEPVGGKRQESGIGGKDPGKDEIGGREGIGGKDSGVGGKGNGGAVESGGQDGIGGQEESYGGTGEGGSTPSFGGRGEGGQGIGGVVSGEGGIPSYGGRVVVGAGGLISGEGGRGAGGSVCVPITCDDVISDWDPNKSTLSKPTACGYVSDGCGDMINCKTCAEQNVYDGTANTDCQQAPPSEIGSWDWTGNGLIPTANICGSRCIKDPQQSQPGSCTVGTTIGGIGWICPSTIPPLGLKNCNIANLEGHTWCCDAT
jgi:hypothetical protein